MIEELQAASRQFGPEAARHKLHLLQAIDGLKRPGRRHLIILQATLAFLEAYPDNAAILKQARALNLRLRSWVGALPGGNEEGRPWNSGLPGTFNLYSYSYGVVRQMRVAHSGTLEIDWDTLEDEGPLLDVLPLLITPGETQGLEDIRISLRRWLDRCKPSSQATDLEFILDLFTGAGLPEAEAAHLYDSLDLPLIYRLSSPGTGRGETVLSTDRTHYQRQPLDRARFPLPPRIRRPLRGTRRLAQASGRRVVNCALTTLGSRNLEIYPLIYANDRDVTVVNCGQGLQVALVGVAPEFRSTLESLFFFMVIKNGIPLAYGPAAVLLGCCEMGINLFPEFRGGDIRVIYAEFMRALHHLLEVDYFYLTPYGMGEDNEDALKSGAFWFYRKLGFIAANPEVEALARSQEALLSKDPRHRSDRRTLRQLSHTSAYLDLSSGVRRPLDLGRLGVAQSSYLTTRFAGDRRRAVPSCTRRVSRALGITDRKKWTADEKRALESLAPLLAMIPDLERWSERDRRGVVRFVRSKGAASEIPAPRLLARHGRLDAALRKLAAAEPST
jgi:hypothetical protein